MTKSIIRYVPEQFRVFEFIDIVNGCKRRRWRVCEWVSLWIRIYVCILCILGQWFVFMWENLIINALNLSSQSLHSLSLFILPAILYNNNLTALHNCKQAEWPGANVQEFIYIGLLSLFLRKRHWSLLSKHIEKECKRARARELHFASTSYKIFRSA